MVTPKIDFWWSSLSFFTAIIMYVIAWKKYKQQDVSNWALTFLILAGLILRFYVAGDTCLHTWDERFHALVAKNMMQHPFQPMLYKTPLLWFDYRDWSTNHIWVHKQPLPLWSMAISMKIFGTHEWALRLPSVLLSTGSIWLVFQLGRILFNQKVAFIAAFLVSIHGLLIELSGGRVATDHIDVFFYFFILLGIYLATLQVENRKGYFSILVGIAVTAAILVKWLPALIVFPVWFCIYLEKYRKISLALIIDFSIAIGTVVLLVFPWQWYIYSNFPQEATWEANFNRKHIFEVLDGQTGPFYYHFAKLARLYGALVYLPLTWLIYQAFHKRSWVHGALITWILVPILFFSLVKTKMQAYTLFCAPAIFLAIALFFNDLLFFLQKEKRKWIQMSIKLILVLLIALPIQYSIERIKLFNNPNRHPVWAQQIKDFRKQISQDTTFIDKHIVIFNAKHPIATMFYLDRTTAYSFIPPKTSIDSIKNAGFLIVYEKQSTYQIDVDE